MKYLFDFGERLFLFKNKNILCLKKWRHRESNSDYHDANMIYYHYIISPNHKLFSF